MTTRLILGAFMLAQVAHAQLAAKPSLATHTVQRETETGSWRAGDAIVWVRVAPTGAVSVYASHGYRSAFAHAIIITPEDADKWADIGEHMLAGQPPTSSNGTIMLADSDLALEPAKAGDSIVLAVRLGGVRPDGLTFLMNGQSLREVLPILRATAKTARAAQAASAAPPPAPAPAPAAATPTTATAPAAAPIAAPIAAPAPAAPAAPVAPTPAAPTPAAPAPAAAAPATPVPATPAPHTAAIDSPPAPVVVAAGPSAPAAPPEVATPDTPAPAPEAEVAPLTPAATRTAVITPTPVVETKTSVNPLATVTPTAVPVVASQKIVKVTRTKPVTQSTVSPSLHRTSAGSIAKPTPAPASTDVSDATKLAGSTVANLVKQWQPQLDLCYTEYGLKVNPALTGSIAVRLAIRPSGDVAAATFTRHNWSGAGGKEAESCMRTRVMGWVFPPASTPSAHEFTVAFAP